MPAFVFISWSDPDRFFISKTYLYNDLIVWWLISRFLWYADPNTKKTQIRIQMKKYSDTPHSIIWSKKVKVRPLTISYALRTMTNRGRVLKRKTKIVFLDFWHHFFLCFLYVRFNKSLEDCFTNEFLAFWNKVHNMYSNIQVLLYRRIKIYDLFQIVWYAIYVHCTLYVNIGYWPLTSQPYCMSRR